MKKCLLAGILSICILLLSGCSFITKQGNAKLPPILFDSPNSVYSCTIEGETYLSTGGSTDDKNLDKKIAVVQNDDWEYKAFSIKGYESRDFIVIKTHGFMENTANIYIKNGIAEVPWEFAKGGMPIRKATFVYSGKNYYYFSAMPENFQPEHQLGTALEKDCPPSDGSNPAPEPTPLYGQESTLYKLPNQSENEWIAVKAPDSDFYLLYWTEDGGIQSVPWAYFELQREYSSYTYPN